MNILREKSVVKTNNRLQKLPLGAVTARGWLREQLLRSKAGMGGHLDELEPKMIATPFINYSSFDRLFDAPADPTFAAGWSSEISGTYWTGLTQLAYTLDDEELIAKASAWVEAVLKHQEPDGYLGGYPEHTDRLADYNAWGSNWCYRALLAFYEATGREDVLDAVYRGLLWFCDHWKDSKTDYAGPTIIESMIVVYAYTGDGRLVRFCEDWLDWLETHSNQQNKVSQYLSQELPYQSMHTVAYGENVKHPAVVWCADGKEEYLQASLNGIRKALRRIVHPTGGAGSNSEFLSPVSADGEVEYCNFATFNHSYEWLAMATGDASWGDEIERCLFNGAEGARRKDERAIAYMTSPNQFYATRSSCIYGTVGDNEAYAPCYTVACCPAQSVRIIPEYVRGMAMTDAENGLYLFCYGPAAVRSAKLDLEMDTLYPFRETIRLKIRRADADAKLYLRVPAWCRAPELTRGGKALPLILSQSGFAQLDAVLAAGDEIELKLPMQVKIGQIDDRDAANQRPMYVERGPLLYSIPVPVRWEAYPGRPITPLPEGWSWYEAFADVEDFSTSPAAMAFDEDFPAEKVIVTEREPAGYVWENPPVTLTLPVKKMRYCTLQIRPKKNILDYGAEKSVEGDDILTELVPYGCTNLRVTYLPRQRKA